MGSRYSFRLAAACAAAVCLLVACGGGGDSATPATPTPPPASPDYNVRSFDYTDANNYRLQYYYSSNVRDGSGLYPFSDLRTGLTAGLPTPNSTLYDSALYASPTGWLAQNGSSVYLSTGGSNATLYQGGYEYTSVRTDTNVAGMTLAAAVARTQDLSVNNALTITGVNLASLAGTMPTGASTRLYRHTLVKSPVRYRVSDGTVPSATDFTQLVLNYPTTATPTAANTVSMARLHQADTCGGGVCAAEALRVTFGAPGVANFYLCDFRPAGSVYSNCVAVGNGNYTLGTAEDGITPIMSFVSLPAAAAAQSFTRVFVNRGGVVYYGWKDKVGGVTVTTRLNKIAFEALAAALGISAPTIATAPSVFAGNWSASYSGGDTGSCPSVVIDVLGNLQGTCTSSVAGGSFLVSGTVNASGATSFTVGGATSSLATFSGTFFASSGAGSWSWPSRSATGNWTAVKN